jgi:hypothetical protein
VDAFVDAVGRATRLGFTDVVTHWPRRASWYAGSESVLETIAAGRLTAPEMAEMAAEACKTGAIEFRR